MFVVPSELRVGSLERRVSVGLGLLDTVYNSLDLCCRIKLVMLVMGSADRNWWKVSRIPVLVVLLRLVVLRRVL